MAGKKPTTKTNIGSITVVGKTRPATSIPMGDQIRKYRKQAGLSQKELADMMDVTRNTVINWESGKYRPDVDLFPVLCSILHISLNELFGMNPGTQEGITQEEWDLIKAYRQISPLSRRITKRTVDSILEEEKKEQEIQLLEKVRMIDFISTAAAAGDGYEYSDIPVEDYRFIYINARNMRANGMIRVKGDSMLPLYHDGDLVYIQYTSDAEPGEDVLCSSVAGMHIKRLSEDGVYSLNKALPFTLTSPDDHVRIIGKVLGIVSSADYPNEEECSTLRELRHEEIREYQVRHALT